MILRNWNVSQGVEFVLLAGDPLEVPWTQLGTWRGLIWVSHCCTDFLLRMVFFLKGLWSLLQGVCLVSYLPNFGDLFQGCNHPSCYQWLWYAASGHPSLCKITTRRCTPSSLRSFFNPQGCNDWRGKQNLPDRKTKAKVHNTWKCRDGRSQRVVALEGTEKHLPCQRSTAATDVSVLDLLDLQGRVGEGGSWCLSCHPSFFEITELAWHLWTVISSPEIKDPTVNLNSLLICQISGPMGLVRKFERLAPCPYKIL